MDTARKKKQKTCNRSKNNRLNLRFTDEDFAFIKQKQKNYLATGGEIKNLSPYLEQVCVLGHSIIKERLFLGEDLKQLVSLGNNLNQVAKRMHQFNKVHKLPDKKTIQKAEQTIDLINQFFKSHT